MSKKGHYPGGHTIEKIYPQAGKRREIDIHAEALLRKSKEAFNPSEPARIVPANEVKLSPKMRRAMEKLNRRKGNQSP